MLLSRKDNRENNLVGAIIELNMYEVTHYRKSKKEMAPLFTYGDIMFLVIKYGIHFFKNKIKFHKLKKNPSTLNLKL